MLKEGAGYKLLEELLKDFRPNSWSSIKGKIEKKIKEGEYSFTDVGYDYLTNLLSGAPKEAKIEEGKMVFKNIFYEGFKKEHKEHFISAFAMLLEGIEDIIDIDILGHPGQKVEDLNAYMKEIYLSSISNSAVLIIGETGTSKGLLAKALHLMSQRPIEKLVEINCVGIPEGLLESELFGHEKGAFTGATQRKIGRFEKAKGGTIFLDEIGKMPLNLQAKVLKAVDEKTFYRINGDKPIKIDVKFVAAAQPFDIEKEHILEDLKYRLGFPSTLKVPTLNERLLSGDSKRIIENSLRKALEKAGLDYYLSIGSEALDILKQHEYKGNYRELENILMRATISAKAHNRDEIFSDDLKFMDEINRNSEDSATVKREKYIDSLKNIPLKDIVHYADKIRASIVEAKVKELMKGGKSVIKILADEGLPIKQYQNLIKKIRTITGKKLVELKR